ncbi:L,D-transpeptidase [Limosilactobacillus mucosae]|uniref:L,D-transpeptidase n=1 Tax=Limosilactobacillus mucosae TaxID=97478 RepID=UPI003A52166C
MYNNHLKQPVATNKTVATTAKSKATSSSSKSQSNMRTPIDWQKSSETVPYPDLSKVKNLWVKVSLKGNRTYLYDGSKLIYTMYSSGGVYQKDAKTGKMKSTTPTGTFYVQAERGDSFYNQELGEGANYYVSWLNHGEYLFHSVPTKADGSYNLKEAAKLGKSTGSHGCIRLSVPDAKWMEQNLPEGTKVVIADN